MADEILSTCESVVTRHHLSSSDIDWSLYPKPFKFTTPISVANLKVILSIYPCGSPKAKKENYCAIYFRVDDTDKEDERFIRLQIKCGLKTKTFLKEASYFIDGNGWGNEAVFRSNALRWTKDIQITVTLYEDTSHVLTKQCPSESFASQLRQMHRQSIRHGDITLLVTLPGDDVGSDLYEPPAKKHRKNHSGNEGGNDHGQVEIKMSSLILSAASPVFKKMLSSNNGMIEQQKKRVTVIAKSVKDVEDLLYFMSTDVLRGDCNAINVMELAQFYQMERLIWKCINRLIQDVSVDIFVKTIKIFDKYEINEGYQILTEFGKKNIVHLKKETSYMLLSHSFRSGILGEGSKRIR